MTTPAQRLLNRGLLLAILGLIAWFVLTIPTRSPAPEQDAAPAGPAHVATPAPAARIAPPAGPVLIPVAGVTPAQLADTFTQARGNARVHDAIDIMAARGTPILAAAAGQVEKLHFSEGGGGISVYVRSADGRWVYYYAHLDRYAPGLAEGQQVRRGGLIGFVGSTGNASPDGPHLHFAINYMRPGERWWGGTPVNPYPILAGSGERR
jgi:murein DD-endopeptidase MepM/ murein hydrolase activator NlpD